MGADLILIDHQEMEKVAAKFNRHSQAAAQTLQEVQRAYQPLKGGGWIGRGANAFFAEMDNRVLPSLRRLIEALALAGRTTDQIRTLMREADEEASAGFRTQEGAGGGETGAGEQAGGDPAPANGGDFGTAQEWLAGAAATAGAASLLDALASGNDGDFGIPQNWFDGVRAALGGGELGAESSDSGDEMGSNSSGGSGGGSGGGDSGGDSGGGSGSGSGGGSGGEPAAEKPTAAETTPSEQTSSGGGGSGGGGSGGGETPFQSNLGMGSGGFSDRSVNGTGADTGAVPARPAAHFQYVGSSGGGQGSAPGAAPAGMVYAGGVATGAGSAPAAPENSGMAVLLALASPLAALAGKAIKRKIEEK